MTDSRDCSDTNEFPGEVRGQEISTIGNILLENPQISLGVDAILLMGDFNIDVSERDILKGTLRSCLGNDVLDINTRITFDHDSGNPILDFNFSSLSSLNPQFRLIEAFSDIHKWKAIGSEDVCSSFNSKRRSWIDMVWHSEASLQVRNRASLQSLSSPIPNAQHGSDHLPLYVLFSF